jgi:hypothetical protein
VRHGWERQREITLHLIYLIVPKGTNKDSELSSVQGTQGMATEWIFATMVAGFLGFFKNDFTSIFLGPIYLYDILYASTLQCLKNRSMIYHIFT